MIEFKKGYKDNRRRVVAIGNFDGFHKGHQMLFSKLQSFKDCIKSIITFENLDKSYHAGSEVLMTMDDKEELKKYYGIDEILYVNFNDEFKHLSPEDFFNYYLNNLNIEALIVGTDFRFGKNLCGDINTIKRLFNKEVIAIDLLLNEKRDKKISTTEIIYLIKNWNIEKANMYLGRKYKVKGTIKHGQNNGHKLGFPTANIQLNSNYVIPGRGVYITSIKLNNKEYLSMTNIGTHPTLDELSTPSIETHIINFTEDIYYEVVELSFIKFLRHENKYANKNDLIKQLNKDKNLIIKYFK